MRNLLAAAASVQAAYAVPVFAATADTLQWPFWGGGILNQNDAANETLISPANVSKLKVQWVYNTAGSVSSTPTIDGSDLYATDWKGYIYKLNRANGALIWKRNLTEFTHRSGSLSRNSPAVTDSLLIFGDQISPTVIAIDKNTGKLVWRKTLDSYGPRGVITSSPVVYNNAVYVGVSSIEEFTVALHAKKGVSFRGSVAAIDVATGNVLWQTPTVPDGYTGGGIWSSTPAVDVSRRSLYVTTGDNYSVPDDVAACINGTTDQAQKAACLAPDDNVDAVVAYDLDTGHMKWNRRLQGVDVWNLLCGLPKASVTQSSKSPLCPVKGNNVDLDFGSGVNIINNQLIGAGQKSGIYWALNPDDGSIVWSTAAGPSGAEGGIEWGAAVDGQRVYVAEANFNHRKFALGPDNKTLWNGGSWAALDIASGGKVVWQTPATRGKGKGPTIASGGVTIANGVLFGGTVAGDFVALDASNGNILWRYASGGSVIDAPSVVDGTVYWGSGYWRIGYPNHQIYAFTVPHS
jgi:polyvinyl alcohol dehydrogenase (cytochrome)